MQMFMLSEVTDNVLMAELYSIPNQKFELVEHCGIVFGWSHKTLPNLTILGNGCSPMYWFVRSKSAALRTLGLASLWKGKGLPSTIIVLCASHSSHCTYLYHSYVKRKSIEIPSANRSIWSSFSWHWEIFANTHLGCGWWKVKKALERCTDRDLGCHPRTNKPLEKCY